MPYLTSTLSMFIRAFIALEAKLNSVSANHHSYQKLVEKIQLKLSEGMLSYETLMDVLFAYVVSIWKHP